MKKILSRYFSNKINSHFGIYFFSQAIIAIINFVLVPIYSRSMDPAEFAKIALIMASIPLISSFMILGQEAAFSIKFYKVTLNIKANMIYTILLNYLIMGILVLSGLYFYRFDIFYFLDIQYSFIILLELFGLLIFGIIRMFYFNLIKMEQKPIIYALNTIIFSLFKVLLLIYLIVYKKVGFMSYIHTNFFVDATFTIIGLVYIIYHYNFSNYKLDFDLIKKLLIVGIPIVPGAIFSMILTSGDQYVLRFYGLFASIGIYAMVYKFANFFSNLIIIPIRYALVPIAMKTGNDNEKDFKILMKKVVENYFVYLYTIIITIYVFFYEFFHFIIADSYHKGFPVIWILILSFIFWGAGNIIGNVIVLYEKTLKTLYLTSLAAMLNIGLNFLLVPSLDFNGAAYATLISYLLVTILYYIFSQKLIIISYNIERIIFQTSLFVIIMILYSVLDKNLNNFTINILIKLFIWFIYVLFLIKRKWIMFDFKKYFKKF
jgi:O-antigen/teichoic acid export membrane protein